MLERWLKSRRYWAFAVTLGLAGVCIFMSLRYGHQTTSQLAAEGFRAVGFGLFAAATTALLYELHSADALRKTMAEQASTEGARAAGLIAASTYEAISKEITKTFRDYIPKRVFENRKPDRQYNDFFGAAFRSSKSYRYRGDTAKITTFQVDRIWSKLPDRPAVYEFLLLNPLTEESFIQRAIIELQTAPATSVDGLDFETQVKNRACEIREEVFVSIYALWDNARKHKAGQRTAISFYDDVPFYRCELMDDGVFLTFYIRGAFQGTFFYDRASLLYKAFDSAFDLGLSDDKIPPCLDLGRLTTPQIVGLLKSLGYPTEEKDGQEALEYLRQRRDQRFVKIAEDFPELTAIGAATA